MNRIRHSMVVALVATASWAQARDAVDDNANMWLSYVGNHQLGESPWSLHLETQVRRAELGQDSQQLLFRPGLTYNINPNLNLTAGYAYVKTYPYGNFPSADDFPEHRIWQQLSYTHEFLGLDWQHRVRLEQRFIGQLSLLDGGDYEVDDYRFENRFRYMLRTTIPITSDKKTYIALSNEVFFNFGENVSGNHFDQNRAFIGIGRKITDSLRLEVGFMEQTLQKRGGKVWEHNHTVGFWLSSKMPFRK